MFVCMEDKYFKYFVIVNNYCLLLKIMNNMYDKLIFILFLVIVK